MRRIEGNELGRHHLLRAAHLMLTGARPGTLDITLDIDGATAAVARLQEMLDAIPDELFADVGGAPAEPDKAQRVQSSRGGARETCLCFVGLLIDYVCLAVLTRSTPSCMLWVSIVQFWVCP